MGKTRGLTYWSHSFNYIWAASHPNQRNGMCAQRRLIKFGIRPVWSESSLSTWGKLRSLAIIRAHSEASDQTGLMSRLIWVFAGRKDHFVGFVMRQLILLCLTCVNNTGFCYFEAFYFLKLIEKARIFKYPCKCMFIIVYYVILHTYGWYLWWWTVTRTSTRIIVENIWEHI